MVAVQKLEGQLEFDFVPKELLKDNPWVVLYDYIESIKGVYGYGQEYADHDFI